MLTTLQAFLNASHSAIMAACASFGSLLPASLAARSGMIAWTRGGRGRPCSAAPTIVGQRGAQPAGDRRVPRRDRHRPQLAPRPPASNPPLPSPGYSAISSRHAIEHTRVDGRPLVWLARLRHADRLKSPTSRARARAPACRAAPSVPHRFEELRPPRRYLSSK